MKWYKKKTFIIPMIVLAVAVLVTAIVFISYYSTTMSMEQCQEFCFMNTKRMCSSFAVEEDGRYKEDYTYWIASYGEDTKPQEAFVFKKKNLGALDLNRYIFITSSVLSRRYEKYSEVGSLLFYPKNDNGRIEPKATIIFYGANSDGIYKDTDRKITYCKYIEDINGEKTEKKLDVTECKDFLYSPEEKEGTGAWIVKFFDIGSGNSDRKIKSIKFYNKSGELIQEYEN